MIRALRNRLRAFLAHDRVLADPEELALLRERLEALEASHAAVAQQVAEALDDRIIEGDKLYAKVRSALGRLYRLKGWEESDAREDAAATATGKPDLAAIMAAKFRRG